MLLYRRGDPLEPPPTPPTTTTVAHSGAVKPLLAAFTRSPLTPHPHSKLAMFSSETHQMAKATTENVVYLFIFLILSELRKMSGTLMG